MKFVKMIDQYGKAFTRLDLEGLKLPNLEPGIIGLLDFHFDTYVGTKAKSSDDEWEKIFGTTHKFLASWNDEELGDFAAMLICMHFNISTVMQREPDGQAVCRLEDGLSQILYDFDQRHNLYPRLVDFIEEGNIPIQSFEGVGERAQDTPEMSWYRPGVVKLTAIVLLCKLLTVIFGTFMSYFKPKACDIDGNLKELHCAVILRDTLHARCSDIIDKFELYLYRTVGQLLNREENLTHVYNGYTDITIHQLIYAQMLTRRFILVDLFKKDGNLITYITSCARSAANTQFSPSGGKPAARMMTYPNETASSEEGNLSNLEVESRSSRKTADYNLLVKAAAIQTIERVISTYDLDRDTIDAAVSYYTAVSHVDMSVYNQYMLGLRFGSGLCGAKSVVMLNSIELAKLTAVLQYHLILQGYNELALALTAKNTGVFKDRISGPDMVLKNNINGSYEYQNCAARFQISINGFDWSTGLKKSVLTFVNYEHRVDLAPVFWDLMKQPNRNGEEFNLTVDFAKDVCGFICQHYNS